MYNVLTTLDPFRLACIFFHLAPSIILMPGPKSCLLQALQPAPWLADQRSWNRWRLVGWRMGDQLRETAWIRIGVFVQWNMLKIGLNMIKLPMMMNWKNTFLDNNLQLQLPCWRRDRFGKASILLDLMKLDSWTTRSNVAPETIC